MSRRLVILSTFASLSAGSAQDLLFLGLVGVLAAPRLSAQSPVMLQGLVDGELWFTDTNSNMLSRNGGRTAVLGRAMVWGAVEPRRGLVLYGLVEGGQA